ncbi:MAG TPA: acyl-CoA dehydrogenase family protein [Polyangiaceae bacterium]|nr:acyl-CoA dehydrogenase family protein [Polyangiaceae bacterium]
MVDKKTVSFMRSLCMGQIEEDVILPFPTISDAEKETLRGVVSSLEQLLKPHEKDFRHWDREGEFPPEFIDELKAFGLFSFVIPEEHGGMGFGSGAYSRALQEVANYDASVAVTVGAHSSIGMRGLLLFGTEEQKARYMPKLATGEIIAAFCLTEPGSGSDAASIKTTAVKDGEDWILNGNKLWITNGGIADFFTVFAKTGEVNERGKMSAFIVTRDMAGVSSGPHEDKMGIRASSTTTVHFENVRVPKENLLGEAGKGFKIAMTILNSGRTGLGGGSVGGMKKLIQLSAKQAKERVQFGKSISEFGLIKQKVGQMVVDCYATEAVVSMVAGLTDGGYQDYAVEAAISKVFAAEALGRTADEALQIAGGNGYMCEYPYERVVRDSRINRIFEGTNDILRLFIALNAMNDAGQNLRDIAKSLEGAFNDPIKGFGVVSEYALRRVSLATGYNRQGTSFTKLDPALKLPATIFEERTRDLATATDRILRKHGRSIIDKQFATRRLADMMIDLFVLASIISRADASLRANGNDKAKKELDILTVFARQADRRIRANMDEIDNNVDESIKALADQAFEVEKFSWDTI